MSNSEQSRRPRTFPGLDADLGPARPLSRADTEWLVEQVVGHVREPETMPQRRRLSLRTLSLAAIVVVSSAAAATVVHQRIQRNDAVAARVVAAPPRQTNKPTHGHAVHERAIDSSENVDVAIEIDRSVEVAPSSQTPATREVPPPVTSASSAVSATRGYAIVDELSAANDLRRQAEWQAAEAAYRSIAAHYPGAAEAAVAQLAAAELRLEHLGDAAGALRLYQSVPRSSALGVEALFGVSRAYRALGNADAEAAALRSLLDAFPTSLQADGARARLKQLSADSTHP